MKAQYIRPAIVAAVVMLVLLLVIGVLQLNGVAWGIAADGVAINEVNFPDANFRAIVAGPDIDKNQDGALADEEIAALTKLDVAGSGIFNLKGLELFTALITLDCSNNQLTALDVSKNTGITSLSAISIN